MTRFAECDLVRTWTSNGQSLKHTVASGPPYSPRRCARFVILTWPKSVPKKHSSPHSRPGAVMEYRRVPAPG